MANCGPSAGLPFPCKNFMPGIKKVAFASFFSGTTEACNFIYSSDTNSVITAGTLTVGKAYIYDLTKEAGDLNEAINANATNGTTSYTDTLTIYLSQFSTAVRNKLTVLAKSKLIAYVLDRNNQWWCMGTDGTGLALGTSSGVDMMPSTSTTGKVYASDANGYTLVFSSTETVPPLEVNSTVMASILSN